MRRAVPLLVVLVLAAPRPAAAFDYLEHAYFVDRACEVALLHLGEALSGDAAAARYLALALTCPQRFEGPYCRDGAKLHPGSLTERVAPDDVSPTLGDLAALGDHLSRVGPVRGLPQAREPGLLGLVLAWLAAAPGSAGDVVADVAEDACDPEQQVEWAAIDQDVSAFLASPVPAPQRFLNPFLRGPVAAGPSDPDSAWSMANPQYIDLVLRSDNHFGEPAHASWLGFHGAAVDVSAQPCEEILGLDADAIAELAWGLPAFAGVDVARLSPVELRRAGCAALTERLRQRLLFWSRGAAPALLAPVKARLSSLQAPDASLAALLARIPSSLAGLVLEGTGLHFVQDGLSGGHVRAVRTRRGLVELRYDHDLDSREGVVALVRTAAGTRSLVLFGDEFLLGPKPASPAACTFDGPLRPAEVTACLLRVQRGTLVAASAASLIDWGQGGRVFLPGEEAAPDAAARALAGEEAAPDAAVPDPFVRQHLVLAAPADPGHALHEPAPLQRGTLPVTPPPFAYQSFGINGGFDVEGSTTLLGLSLALHSALARDARWMTSTSASLVTTLGERQASQVVGSLAYRLQWRWSARFTLDAGPFWFGGLRGFSQDLGFFSGLGPSASLTALPEGWVKIPLEVTVGYRLPLTLFTSDHGFSGESFSVDGHLLEVGLGLAFM